MVVFFMSICFIISQKCFFCCGCICHVISQDKLPHCSWECIPLTSKVVAMKVGILSNACIILWSWWILNLYQIDNVYSLYISLSVYDFGVNGCRIVYLLASFSARLLVALNIITWIPGNVPVYPIFFRWQIKTKWNTIWQHKHAIHYLCHRVSKTGSNILEIMPN